MQIRNNVAVRAKAAGIDNPGTLARLARCGRSSIIKLWRGASVGVHFSTLAAIAEAVGANDINELITLEICNDNPDGIADASET